MAQEVPPLHALVTIPSRARKFRLQAISGEINPAEQYQSGDVQAQMLAEWMRAMHFPQRGRQSRGIHKGRFHVRTVVLEPLKTNF
ncbi:MAG: hypothetical protein KF756_09585 [Acidobacteria bacterium]|nr:hypothetical protein [Acidobacteriota bacterium]